MRFLVGIFAPDSDSERLELHQVHFFVGIPDERYFVNGTIPWIKIADATASGKYLYETRQKVNSYGASFSRLMPKGSLIIAASGTLGYTQILGVPGCIHDGWMYLDELHNTDVDFLFYCLQFNNKRFYNAAYGAAIQNINTEILRQTEILHPPLETQRKIGAILSSYDDLIENNSRRIQILEEMARGLYREWFVNFRFPGFEDVEMVDSSLGLIPAGWDVVAFSSLVKLQSGGTPRTNDASFWNGGIPFFTPKDAPVGAYVTGTEKTISSEGLARCNSRLYEKDTVFITARGTVGKVALAGTAMAMNQSCYALTAKQRFTQKFLYLMTLSCVDRLKQQATGAVFDTITLDTFDRLEVVAPPERLASRFTLIIDSLLERTLGLTLKIINLRRTRDLLLLKLISGEVDVSQLEVAGVTVP